MHYRPVFEVRDVLMGFKSHFKEDDVFKSGCKGEGQELPLNYSYWYSLNVISDYFYSRTPVRMLILLCWLGTEIPINLHLKENL